MRGLLLAIMAPVAAVCRVPEIAKLPEPTAEYHTFAFVYDGEYKIEYVDGVEVNRVEVEPPMVHVSQPFRFVTWDK